MSVRDRRGGMLVQAVILIAILGLLSSLSARLMLGRAMIVEKVTSGKTGGALSQAADSALSNCLQDITQPQCTAARMTTCGFPLTVDGHTMSAVPNWVNNSCQVTVTIN